MSLPPRLDHALLAALACPEERDLALLWNHARESHARERGGSPSEAPGLSRALRERLAALQAADAVAAELDRARRLGLELIGWLDPRHPEALHDLAAPPPVLWLRGAGPWPPVAPITIVGARASTARGRAFARELGEGVAARAGSVVSGLAIGIDQAAHEGALAVPGPCYAVLACGVDQIYPPGAAELAQRIERKGRIVSELPIGTPPYKLHFPRRNRILAALGRSTLVVEADLRSGSLITAHRALELGRGVHAVPGAIDAPTSRGTNRLIRDGAHPLLGVEDLDLLLHSPAAPWATDGTAEGRGSGDRSRFAATSADELLHALQVPTSVEELAERTGAGLDRVLLKLVELEADGRVARLGGGLYVRVP